MNKHFKNEPRSYVVRVYRRTTKWFAGCVEDVRSGRVRSFRNASELWAAIGGSSPRKSNSTRREP